MSFPKTESDFLTEIQKWAIMGAKGTPQQQEEARQWLKDHVDTTGGYFTRIRGPHEALQDFCENMNAPRSAEEIHKVTRLKLDDALTAVAILNELASPEHESSLAAPRSAHRHRRVRWLRAGKNLSQP